MRRRCESGGKLRFATEGEAVRFGRSGKSKGRRMRAYLCPACRGFHLTKEAHRDAFDE